METILSSIGFLGVIFVFLVLIIGIIIIFKFILKHTHKQLVSKKNTSVLDSKKYADVDVERYRPIIINLAIIISLAFIISILEFPFAGKESAVTLSTNAVAEYEEMHEIPPTKQLPPPPPQIKHPNITEVANEEIIEEEIEIDLDIEMEEEQVIEELTEPKIEEVEEEEEDMEQVFLIVEENAEPIGGYKAFYEFFKKNLKYPKPAKRLGIEGKVYLQFVVGPTGEITSIKVLRGIGAGCDEEAVRVLKKSPKWKPGKQRGRNVKQQMNVPIHFKMAEG